MSENGTRLPELDSIRGIAAFSVVMLHAMNILSVWGSIPSIVKYSPVRLFWGGHQAVIMFFVLSGFVLSLPFYSSKINYRDFLLKRFNRIYIPYFVALTLAIICRWIISKGEIAGVWSGEVNTLVILRHYLLIDSFNSETFNSVFWSLVHEMRISIVFPIIIFVVTRYNWKISMGIGFFLSLLGTLLHFVFQHRIDRYTNYFDSMHYILMFIVGALIAKHRINLSHIWNETKGTKKFIIFSFGLLLYIYSDGIKGGIFRQNVSDWSIMIGSVVIVITAIARNSSWILLNKPIVFLGKISYSLYLYHIILLLTLNTLLGNILPKGMLFGSGLLLSIGLSTLAYYFVEKPSIKMNKILSRRSSNETVSVYI